ncbi:MAG: DUF459 domain-containing protein [Hyphomicrobiaceae bacterium]|nr:DUF459 domain-containing protein [Hyphomicrobiaceae bacterium]
MRLARLLIFCLGVLILVTDARPVFAQAWDMIEEQQDRQIRERGGGNTGLIDMLFGGSRRERSRRTVEPGGTGSRDAVTATPRITLIEKDAEAGVVVVIGDTLATQIAIGLTELYTDEPSVVVEDRSDGASGLVRTDRRNWFDAVPEILATPRLAAVVIVVGLNDGQDLRGDDGPVPFGTDAWMNEYRSRVSGLALALSTRAVPIIWVGLPPVRPAQLGERLQLINRLLREGTLGTAATYVDVFTAFADANGHYTRQGPDMDGQNRNMRSSDGIHFTSAGRVRFAHFVERFIPRGANEQRLAALGIQAAVYQGSALSEDGIGPIVSLEAAPGSAIALDVDPDEVLPRDENAVARLVEGQALPTLAGRADDFSWPPQAALPARPAQHPANEFDGL